MMEELKKNSIEVSEILKILSSNTRLLIVCMLLEREMYVGEILESIGSTKGNISQHLKVLSLKGIISNRKVDNFVYYSIADKRIHNLLKSIKNIFCTTTA